MSVHNGERHLAEAIASILGQTLRDLELVAIDDGSTDATAAMLAQAAAGDARVRVVTLAENIGLTRALNRGLAVARGELIARMDADDVAEPERLAEQADFLDANLGVVVLGTACRVIDDAGHASPGWRMPLTDAAIRWRLLFHNPFIHATVMFRRSALEAVGGGYDESLPCSQDMELWGRLLDHGLGANLARPLARFRRHAASVSVTRAAEQQAVATGLAWARMRKLAPGLAISREQAALARACFGGLPPKAGEEAARACRLYFPLMDAVARRAGGMTPELRLELRQLARNLGRSATLAQWGAMAKTGLACAFVRRAPSGMVLQAIDRLRMACGMTRPQTGPEARP
jgi:hypothetical protein